MLDNTVLPCTVKRAIPKMKAPSNDSRFLAISIFFLCSQVRIKPKEFGK